MTLQSAKLVCESICLLTVAVCAVFATRSLDRVLKHVDGAVVRAEGIETKLNATLINLDKGTATWAAASKEQTAAIQDLATDAHGMISQANLALESIPPVSQFAVDELKALYKTTDAATGLTMALTGDATEAKTTIAAAQPLLASYTQSGNDLDALLKDHAVRDTITDVEFTTQNLAGVTNDLRRVADKETEEFLKPVPWWKWPIKRAGQVWDIGAAVARHTP